MLRTSEVVASSRRRIRGVQCFVILLFGTVFATEGSDSKTLPLDSRQAVTTRRAMMLELRRDSENLRELLQSNASSADKQKAVDAFRTRREAWRSMMLADIPEQTAEEKASLRQRIKERIAGLPEERRKVMEERLAIVEEMEALRSEQKRLSPEERQIRMHGLMERRRRLMESQRAAMEAAATSKAKDQSKVPPSPFLETLAAEKEKLNAAMSSRDPDARRAAVEQFRAAVEDARQARWREMEQRLRSAVPPPLEPRSHPYGD